MQHNKTSFFNGHQNVFSEHKTLAREDSLDNDPNVAAGMSPTPDLSSDEDHSAFGVQMKDDEFVQWIVYDTSPEAASPTPSQDPLEDIDPKAQELASESVQLRQPATGSTDDGNERDGDVLQADQSSLARHADQNDGAEDLWGIGTIPTPTTEGRQHLHAQGIPPSRATSWDSQKSERVQHSPNEHANDTTEGVKGNTNRGVKEPKSISENPRNEERLCFFFSQDSDPDWKEKQSEAIFLGLSVEQVDRWYWHKRRGGSQKVPANTQDQSQKNKKVPGDAPAGNTRSSSNRRPADDTGKPNNSSKEGSIASDSSFQESPLFASPQNTRSDPSEATDPTTSSQRSTFKCTMKGCKSFSPKSKASWIRHEMETHWPQFLYICIICGISLTDKGEFECNYCQSVLKSLTQIKSHLLSECDSINGWKLKGAFQTHQKMKHRDGSHVPLLTSTINDGIQVCLQCRFCDLQFGDAMTAHNHSCENKYMWLADWMHPLKNNFFPPECIFGCSRPFKTFEERAEHYCTIHFETQAQSRKALKRTQIEQAASDQGEADTNNALNDGNSIFDTISLHSSRGSRRQCVNRGRNIGGGRRGGGGLPRGVSAPGHRATNANVMRSGCRLDPQGQMYNWLGAQFQP